VAERRHSTYGIPRRVLDRIGVGPPHLAGQHRQLPLVHRLTPEAMTMTGAPSTVKTSDFAICPTPTPTASAACWEVRASTGSSSTVRPRQMASSAVLTRAAAGFTAA
jgi:hypothetical protein